MSETNLHQAAPAAPGTAKSGRWRAAASAVPVTLVNATAFIGQFSFLRDHVPWILPGIILVAVTFESVAVYLAWSAHIASMQDDSATRLRIGAYLFAFIMGAMNYSHYAGPHWHPTPMAVGMGLMSAISPALWGVHTRRASRAALMAKGLIEPHAVRLGANRWTWHLYRSIQVMWHATWTGENDPKRAIAMYETARQSRRAIAEARRASISPRRQRTLILQDRKLARQVQEIAEPAHSGAPELIEGTLLNGHPLNGTPKQVGAIASLSARPVLAAKHDIDPARIAAVRETLKGVPAGQRFPSQREVAAMLCGEPHDHRRQAQPLLAEAQAARAVTTRRLVPVSGSDAIAAPVATLPGGTHAHG